MAIFEGFLSFGNAGLFLFVAYYLSLFVFLADHPSDLRTSRLLLAWEKSSRVAKPSTTLVV